MEITMNNGSQRKKIHPHKFTLWVAIASIIMMFAGLTSAYIVKGSQPGWTSIEIPKLFYYSTMVILLSSFTMQWALKSFKERKMNLYRRLITVTAVLGIGFIALQILGFNQLWNDGVTFQGSTGAGQFPVCNFCIACTACFGRGDHFARNVPQSIQREVSEL